MKTCSDGRAGAVEEEVVVVVAGKEVVAVEEEGKAGVVAEEGSPAVRVEVRLNHLFPQYRQEENRSR